MDIKRVLRLVGGQTAAATLLGKSVQGVAYAATGKRRLDKASEVVLATHGASAAIEAHGLKASPFVRAWVAKMLAGDSQVTLPRGFGSKTVVL